MARHAWRAPPGLAFREGASPGDVPVVTFEAKRAFDAFADSLTAETMIGPSIRTT